MAMTSEAKRGLSQTIRKLRVRLLDELGEAIQGAARQPIEIPASFVAGPASPAPELAQAKAEARQDAFMKAVKLGDCQGDQRFDVAGRGDRRGEPADGGVVDR